MRLKKVVPDISRPKKSRHFLMHRMSLKLLDNFQICEHSWPCLFHIKLLLSESDVSCLLRVRSVPFTSRAKGCIKFVLHSCLVSLWHKVGVFLEVAICYFIYAKFAVMSLKVVHQYGCFESCQFRSRSVFFVSSRLKCLADDLRCLRYYSIVTITLTTSAFHSRRCGRL